MENYFCTIPKEISDRVNWAIELAWNITVCKIVDGEISVNKEASLQLHYSVILKAVLELIKFSPTERVDIKLETGVTIEEKPYIIDILLEYEDGTERKRHSIELKCYKSITSSEKKRGASDIFMKDVYLDLYYSELYLQYDCAHQSTCLVFTDYENFIRPKSKKTKNWTYDISQGHFLKGRHFNTPIGGKDINFKLRNNYKFDWKERGKYWAALLRPQENNTEIQPNS